MNDNKRQPQQRGLVNASHRLAAGILGLALFTTACGDDDKKNSNGYEVLAPDAEVGGQDATALLTEYGRSLTETPLDENSLVDPNKCDQGISTDEVYFAPTFGAPGDSTAACTMKKDQVLFLNPVATLCIETDGDTATTGCLDGYWNLTSSSVTIDGTAISGLEDRQYDTEVGEVDLPEGNIFEIDAQTTKFIQRGQVLLVKGLSVGEHVIVLGGNFGDGEFAGQLTLTLTVE